MKRRLRWNEAAPEHRLVTDRFKRFAVAKNLRDSGYTYRAIGEAFGISAERARQIVITHERLTRRLFRDVLVEADAIEKQMPALIRAGAQLAAILEADRQC